MSSFLLALKIVARLQLALGGGAEWITNELSSSLPTVIRDIFKKNAECLGNTSGRLEGTVREPGKSWSRTAHTRARAKSRFFDHP